MTIFENRTYRTNIYKQGLTSFDITVKETNLNIQAETDLQKEATAAVLKCRHYIEQYIHNFPEFLTSMIPLTSQGMPPGIIQEMISASQKAEVGPMAAIAGAIAEYTGRCLLQKSNEIVVENGGDVFIKSDTETLFTIYAHNSPLSMKTGIVIEPKQFAYSICTSSGTIGHSKSYGKADAVTVFSESASLSDASATSIGNHIQKKRDIPKAIEYGRKIEGILGIVIIKGDKIGLWGDMKLVKV